MREPKIISGNTFDWEKGKEFSDNVVNEDGNVNWYAAMGADPGCTKCPECGEFYWNMAKLVECLDCGTVWDTESKETVCQKCHKPWAEHDFGVPEPYCP